MQNAEQTFFGNFHMVHDHQQPEQEANHTCEARLLRVLKPLPQTVSTRVPMIFHHPSSPYHAHEKEESKTQNPKSLHTRKLIYSW